MERLCGRVEWARGEQLAEVGAADERVPSFGGQQTLSGHVLRRAGVRRSDRAHTATLQRHYNYRNSTITSNYYTSIWVYCICIILILFWSLNCF